MAAVLRFLSSNNRTEKNSYQLYEEAASLDTNHFFLDLEELMLGFLLGGGGLAVVRVLALYPRSIVSVFASSDFFLFCIIKPFSEESDVLF